MQPAEAAPGTGSDPTMLLPRRAPPFRIYDGPSEVSRVVVARDWLKNRARR